MCLLWILLQFVVVFLTVDLPPIEKRKARDSMTRKNQEEENEKSLVEDVEESDEEGKPLIVSQELMGSYGSVVASSPPRNTTLNPNPSPHSPVSPAESSGVFKNFSISRGQWFTWLLLGALPVCSTDWIAFLLQSILVLSALECAKYISNKWSSTVCLLLLLFLNFLVMK